jgi:glutamate dehydrogenase/leucine dehydrogenase
LNEDQLHRIVSFLPLNCILANTAASLNAGGGLGGLAIAFKKKKLDEIMFRLCEIGSI